MKNFPGVVANTRIPNCIWDNTYLCSDSSQYVILSQSLVQIGPDILMKVLEDYIFILYLGILDFV